MQFMNNKYFIETFNYKSIQKRHHLIHHENILYGNGNLFHHTVVWTICCFKQMQIALLKSEQNCPIFYWTNYFGYPI